MGLDMSLETSSLEHAHGFGFKSKAFLRQTQNSLTFFDQISIHVHYPTGFGLAIPRSSV